jgi:hypothetical protein
MISPELMEQWATRDADGNRLRWEWRQPDADGWWEPVITTDYADNLLDAERARHAALVAAAREVLGCCDREAHGFDCPEHAALRAALDGGKA